MTTTPRTGDQIRADAWEKGHSAGYEDGYDMGAFLIADTTPNPHRSKP